MCENVSFREGTRFTLPKTSSKFASEHGWLEYEFRFLSGQSILAYFQGVYLAVSFREGCKLWPPVGNLDFRRSNFSEAWAENHPKKHGCHSNLSPFFFAREKLWEVFFLEFRSASNNYVYYQTNIRMTSNTRRFSSIFPMGIFLLNNKRTPQFNFFRTKSIFPQTPWENPGIFHPPFPKNGVCQQKSKKKPPEGTLPSLRVARRFCSSSEFGSGAESSWYDSFGTEQVWVPTRQRSKVPLVSLKGIRWE